MNQQQYMETKKHINRMREVASSLFVPTQRDIIMLTVKDEDLLTALELAADEAADNLDAIKIINELTGLHKSDASSLWMFFKTFVSQ